MGKWVGGARLTCRTDTEPPLPWGAASCAVAGPFTNFSGCQRSVILEHSVVQKTLLSTHGVCSDRLSIAVPCFAQEPDALQKGPG